MPELRHKEIYDLLGIGSELMKPITRLRISSRVLIPAEISMSMNSIVFSPAARGLEAAIEQGDPSHP